MLVIQVRPLGEPSLSCGLTVCAFLYVCSLYYGRDEGKKKKKPGLLFLF